MPRRKRSYLPGAAFHITARTHGGEFWFQDLRSQLVEIIALALKQTDALLLAYAIMTNHIHLVLRQGNAPLSQLMHPLCQRTAYAVHRQLKRTGYVMEYRYFDTFCSDDAHLRNAIMYTHRNPIEAGLCEDPSEYEWSSDHAYRSPSVAAKRITMLRPAIELFASGLPDRTAHQDYADFYAWYDACKKLAPDDARPHTPAVTAGDVYWMQNFGAKRKPAADSSRSADLCDVVRRALSDMGSVVTLDELRLGIRTKPVAAVRNTVIERALRAGHRPIDIARFLKTSDSTVCRVNVARTRAGE